MKFLILCTSLKRVCISCREGTSNHLYKFGKVLEESEQTYIDFPFRQAAYFSSNMRDFLSSPLSLLLSLSLLLLLLMFSNATLPIVYRHYKEYYKSPLWHQKQCRHVNTEDKLAHVKTMVKTQPVPKLAHLCLVLQAEV